MGYAYAAVRLLDDRPTRVYAVFEIDNHISQLHADTNFNEIYIFKQKAEPENGTAACGDIEYVTLSALESNKLKAVFHLDRHRRDSERWREREQSVLRASQFRCSNNNSKPFLYEQIHIVNSILILVIL